jgi:hypothetical protein
MACPLHRVVLIPVVRRTLFGPRITIFTRYGRSFTKGATGRDFIWDFEEEVRRIRPVGERAGIGDAQFAELIDACRRLDSLDGAARRLISLTLPRSTGGLNPLLSISAANKWAKLKAGYQSPGSPCPISLFHPR